ncbi:MAG: UvrD-helicase domain-containing protein, partial [Erysipelotrichaceae bacterium]|nr:UvrD-helicase domain-containing protein [Erysipelotrichaceae bacterium]
MEDYLEKLNPQQRAAVTTESKYVRVIAGAGSGKTRVLTSRVIFLIREWGIAPYNIMAITFTNKAAREMKDRIGAMLPDEGSRIQISTIHSFCVTVLRREIIRENYPRNFTILDPDDQKSILREALRALDFSVKDYNLNSLLDYIAGNKVAGFDYEDALNHSYSTHEENKAKIYKYYLERQKQLYALDFDDLLLWTNEILKKYPDVRQYWQQRFQFILVDEFQDIDKVQYELITLLSDEGTYVYVVGDPDQTIYTWRGADINIIMNFEKDFKPTETIVLERNYRSTGNILNASNSLIQYNRQRVKKDLYTESEPGSKIIHYSAPNEEMEAVFVCDKILSLTKGQQNYNDCAILYRANYLSRAFEKALMDLKIPYVIYGGIRFYERAEIKDALSYLRMLVTQDDLSFKRIINTPKRGIGDTSVEKLLDYARENNLTMYQAAAKGFMPSKTQSKLDQFVRMIEDFRIRMKDMELEKVLQMVLDETGYRSMLELSTDPLDVERIENLKELISDIKDF